MLHAIEDNEKYQCAWREDNQKQCCMEKGQPEILLLHGEKTIRNIIVAWREDNKKYQWCMERGQSEISVVHALRIIRNISAVWRG